MRPLIQEISTAQTPESLVEQLHGEPGLVLLRSASFDSPQARYSFIAARPFLTFRSSGSRCEITQHGIRTTQQIQFGNPWQLLDALLARCELLDEIDLPFPLGGCFGYWGYDLKNFVEPKLPRRAVNDLELPDCHVGFYDSLIVFDHRLGKTCVVSTGLQADGSRSQERAQKQNHLWVTKLAENSTPTLTPALSLSERERENGSQASGKSRSSELVGALDKPDGQTELLPLHRRGGEISPKNSRIEAQENIQHPTSNIQCSPVGRLLEVGSSMLDVGCSPALHGEGRGEGAVSSNLSRPEFLAAVERVQRYIRAGDIYQANLSQRLSAPCEFSGWELFQRLSAVSPAPFSAFLDCGEFQIASSSPEQFLRLSGPHIQTRPIKGTRPRAADPTRDAQLAYELQTSAKELAELVMITDLLRNDLGKVCEYGSVQVPELAKLEKFAQVQHLVSTVEGRLRKDVTHFAAFASCFPGGSITGAPKIRAMEIIDELEPISRGPYCGAMGYLGFNRESQLSITIRTAICQAGVAHFNVGAGIVADSNPAAEYEETLAKAAGFLAVLENCRSRGEEPHFKIENGTLI